MNVLVACEYSGVVREAFRRRGHFAMSCDFLPTEQPGPHFEDAAEILLDFSWDLLIAHPPCTYLANSGVRWLHTNPDRHKMMRAAAQLFRVFLDAPIPRIAVENPIMHGYGKALIGAPHTQVIQPWMFGHGEIKATCLWLKNLPPLMPENVVEGRSARVHRMPPGPDRWKERSRTLTGVANAMANQWG